MRKAYLIAFVDTRAAMPTIVKCGIYGSEAGSLTNDYNKSFPVDIFETSGADYEEAVANARRKLFVDPYLQWLVPLFLAPQDLRGTTVQGARRAGR